MVLAIDFFHLLDIDFFYQQIMILEDGNNIYSIFYFCTLQKKIYLKKLVEFLINTTFHLTFSCSTGDEWNLVYNKK